MAADHSMPLKNSPWVGDNQIGTDGLLGGSGFLGDTFQTENWPSTRLNDSFDYLALINQEAVLVTLDAHANVADPQGSVFRENR